MSSSFKMNVNQKTSLPIRAMTLDDLDEVVLVHKKCFPASVSLFSALDDEVAKSFYRQAVKEPESYAEVLTNLETDKVVGFAIGTLNAGFRKRLVKRNLLKFCWYIFKGLLTNSHIWKMAWIRVKNSRNILADRPSAEELVITKWEPAKGREAMFMPIALSKEARGGGNAVRLANHLTQTLFQAGAYRVSGKIAANNMASLKLFQKIGWSSKLVSNQYYSVWTDKSEDSKA